MQKRRLSGRYELCTLSSAQPLVLIALASSSATGLKCLPNLFADVPAGPSVNGRSLYWCYTVILAPTDLRSCADAADKPDVTAPISPLSVTVPTVYVYCYMPGGRCVSVLICEPMLCTIIGIIIVFRYTQYQL